jgi:hypothetical protein
MTIAVPLKVLKPNGNGRRRRRWQRRGRRKVRKRERFGWELMEGGPWGERRPVQNRFPSLARIYNTWYSPTLLKDLTLTFSEKCNFDDDSAE